MRFIVVKDTPSNPQLGTHTDRGLQRKGCADEVKAKAVEPGRGR